MRIVTATAVALALVGAAAPAATAHQPATDGIWRTDGYGTVLSIRNGTLQEYQTTAVSCIAGDTAQRTAPGAYTTPRGTVLTVRTRGDRDRASVRLDGDVGERNLRRMTELPDACTRSAPGGPLASFDVFWQSFEENYPFFAVKGIDWHAVRDRYRPTVHEDTTPDELFAVFSKMVEPLHDAHVAVWDVDGDGDGDPDRAFAQVRPGTVRPDGTLDAKVKKFVVERDLKDARNLRDFAAGRITYADLPGGQGYLRISGFGGYAGGKASYAAELAELDKALDTVLGQERTRHLKGLVIDLRINGGGSDAMGLHIAGRLTDTPTSPTPSGPATIPRTPPGTRAPSPCTSRPPRAPATPGRSPC